MAAIAGRGGGGDAAGGLGEGAAAAAAHGLGERRQVHVVEQHGVHPERQRLVQLFQSVHLDLDLHHVTDGGARPLDRRAEAAGQGAVVVLDQHAVVEAEAMVAAAAAAHRVLLEGAQPGGGLAGADDARGVRPDRRHQLAGGGGDAGEAAEEVERRALGREEGAGGSAHHRQDLAGDGVAAVGEVDLDRAAGVEQAEGGERRLQPGDPTRRPRHHARLGAEVGRQDGVAGQVAGAAEVLLEGAPDDRLVQQGVEGGHRAPAAADTGAGVAGSK